MTGLLLVLVGGYAPVRVGPAVVLVGLVTLATTPWHDRPTVVWPALAAGIGAATAYAVAGVSACIGRTGAGGFDDAFCHTSLVRHTFGQGYEPDFVAVSLAAAVVGVLAAFITTAAVGRRNQEMERGSRVAVAAWMFGGGLTLLVSGWGGGEWDDVIGSLLWGGAPRQIAAMAAVSLGALLVVLAPFRLRSTVAAVAVAALVGAITGFVAIAPLGCAPRAFAMQGGQPAVEERATCHWLLGSYDMVAGPPLWPSTAAALLGAAILAEATLAASRPVPSVARWSRRPMPPLRMPR